LRSTLALRASEEEGPGGSRRVPGWGSASSGIRADLLSVYFRQEGERKERSTLIHVKWYQSEFLSVYFRQGEKRDQVVSEREISFV
jgi:hypothetical protein